jgi:hypothetical protein
VRTPRGTASLANVVSWTFATGSAAAWWRTEDWKRIGLFFVAKVYQWLGLIQIKQT